MTNLKWPLLIGAMLLAACNNQKESIVLVDLRTEHLHKPIGLDTEAPRFSWKIGPDNLVENQGAYHIFVDTDSIAVTNGKGALWEKRNESDSTLITYRGKPLQPFTKYFWGVQVMSDKDKQNFHCLF